MKKLEKMKVYSKKTLKTICVFKVFHIPLPHNKIKNENG